MRYRLRSRAQRDQRWLRRRNPENAYTVTFQGGTTRPIWEITSGQYLAAIGVHQPWIMEISPLQYSRMSNRAKTQYDEKRRGEWQASADAAEQWRQLVVRAYAEGLVTPKTPGVSREAWDVMWSVEVAKSEAQRAAERQRVSAVNSVESVPEGAIIFDRMWQRYARLLKRLKAGGLKVEYADGNTAKKDSAFFNILSDEDVKEEGLTSASSKADFLRSARSRWKGTFQELRASKTRSAPLQAPARSASSIVSAQSTFQPPTPTRRSLWVVRVHTSGAPSIYPDTVSAVSATKHLGEYGSTYAHVRNHGTFDLHGPGASGDDLRRVVLTLDPEAQVRKLKVGIRVSPPSKVLSTFQDLDGFWQAMARQNLSHQEMMIAMINHPAYRALPADRRGG